MLKNRLPSNTIGDFHRMAPEMFQNKPYRYSVDWWAFGTILYECTYGKVLENNKLPFKIESEEVASATLDGCKLEFPETNRISGLSVQESQVRDSLYAGLLEPSIHKRIGSSNGGLGFAKDIMCHPWFATIDWKMIQEKQLVPKVSLINKIKSNEPENLSDTSRKSSISSFMSKTFKSLIMATEESADEKTMEAIIPHPYFDLMNDVFGTYYTPYCWESPDQQLMETPPIDFKEVNY